jgi:prefoldin beta subunit
MPGLDFANTSRSRLETRIKEAQGEIERKKGEIIQVQASAQAGGAPAVKA